MLRSGLKRAAERLLPASIVRRLDPFVAAIEDFVAEVARATPPGAVVLDAGAGEARHGAAFAHARYLALDSAVGDAAWSYAHLDARGDLTALPLRDGSADRVLCVVVLEHVREPAAALAEFARVLRPGGTLALVTPQLWEAHQRPHDYFRYTEHGVRYLVERAGLEVVALAPLGGFFWVLGRRLLAVLGFLQGSWRWPLFALAAPPLAAAALLCHALDPLDRARDYTLGHRCLARKAAAPAAPGAPGARG